MAAIQTPLFYRIVAADRKQGYLLLVGRDNKLVRSTAEAAITLSLLNRERLEKMLAKVQENFRATELIDITADGIKRQLEKLFTSQDLGV